MFIQPGVNQGGGACIPLGGEIAAPGNEWDSAIQLTTAPNYRLSMEPGSIQAAVVEEDQR